jgi:O-antigen/teichoic acid export membrane protein
MQLLSIVALLGLDTWLTRRTAALKAQGDLQGIAQAYRSVSTITLSSSILLAGILFLAAPLLSSSIFGKPALAHHLQTISIALPLLVLTTVHAGLFRGVKNMTGFTLFKSVIPLLNTLILLLAHTSMNQISPGAAYVISTAIVLAGYVWIWRRSPNHVPIEQTGLALQWRPLIHESLPMMITGSIFFIMNWVDNLVIGIFRTEAEVGMYDSAFKIASVAAITLMAINAIQAPSFAEHHSKQETGKLRASVRRSGMLLFYTSLPLSIVLFIFPEWILSFFGPGFSSAADCVRILVIGNFINAWTGSVGILLQMTGYHQQYNRIILYASILSVLMNLVLVPMLGILGAAISSSATKALQNLAATLLVHRKLHINTLHIPGSGLFKKTTSK